MEAEAYFHGVKGTGKTVLMIDGESIVIEPGSDPHRLVYMPPGSFCPDVFDLQDLGEADYMRGRVIRAFMRLMAFWPKKTG